MEFTVQDDGGRARVTYACPCGCTPVAVVLAASDEPGSEHCCCGRVHFAGTDAAAALQHYLSGRRERGEDTDIIYHFSESSVSTEWDDALPVAYAVPESELYRESISPSADEHGDDR